MCNSDGKLQCPASEYTPTTADVRYAYEWKQDDKGYKHFQYAGNASAAAWKALADKADVEFDRWLAEVEAKAAAKEQERIIKVLQDKIKWQKRNGSVDDDMDMGILIGLDTAIEIAKGKDNDQ
jgi:hypothetical protein